MSILAQLRFCDRLLKWANQNLLLEFVDPIFIIQAELFSALSVQGQSIGYHQGCSAPSNNPSQQRAKLRSFYRKLLGGHTRPPFQHIRQNRKNQNLNRNVNP